MPQEANKPFKFEEQPMEAPAQSTPDERPVGANSVKGYLQNTYEGAANMVKGMADGILLSWPRAIKEMPYIAKNVNWLTKADVSGELKRTGSAIADSLLEPWSKASEHIEKSKDPTAVGKAKDLVKTLGQAMYEDTPGRVLDLLTAYDLGMTSVGALGKVTGLSKLETMANTAKAIPGRLVGKVADAGAAKLGIDLPKIRETLGLKGEAKAAAGFDSKVETQKIVNVLKQASKEEIAVADRWVEEGGTAAEMAANPKAKAIYDAYHDFLKTKREAGLKTHDLLNDEELRQRVVKQLSVSKGIDEAAAAALYDSSEVKPLYKPTETELKSGRNFMESIEMPSEKPQGKAGFLERFTGKNPLSKNPMEYMPRVVKAWHEVEGNLNYVNRVLQRPSLIQGTAKAGETLGEAIPSYGIYKRYFDKAGAAKAQAVELARYIEKNGPDALKKYVLDSEAKARISKAQSIILDPTVKNLLKMEFTKWTGTPGYLLNTYDRILGLFKGMATKYNPKFYTGNAVGDAVLSLIAGVSPQDFRLAAGLKDVMPPIAGMASDIAGGVGKVQSFFELFSEADVAAKQWLIAGRVKDALIKAGIPAERLEAELRNVLPSIRDLGNAEVSRQLLHEQIVKQVDQLSTHDETLARLRKREEILTAKYNKAARESPGAPSPKRQETYGRLQEIKQQIENVSSIRNQIIADYEARAIQSGKLEAMIPGLRQNAEMVRPAIKEAGQFFGEYLAMHPIEQYVFRRLIPFWSFNKAMGMLAFRLPFIAPKNAFLWQRYSAYMTSMMGDPELPEYARSWFPMFVNDKGKTAWLKMTGWNPFNSVGTTSVANIPIPKFMDPWENNPFVSLMAQVKDGRTYFTQSSVPFGEHMVNIHNGDVVEFTPNGIRKVIPQMPMDRAIAQFFPSVQMAEQLLVPYQMSPKGWIGNPEPMLNPDGSVKHPKELWSRLLHFVGGPATDTKNREEMIRGDRKREMDAVNQMKAMYKKTNDPDEREKIKNTVQDYLQTQRERRAAR